MSTLSQRLDLLTGCDVAARAAILADAVDRGRPDELAALVRAAVATAAPAALAATIRHLHRLESSPEPLLRRVRSDRLASAAAAVLAEPEPRSPLNLVALAVIRPDPAIVALLPRMLADKREGVAAAAGEGLLEIARSLHGASGRRRSAPKTADGLDRALAAAGRTYRVHRSQSVLLAIAILSERPRESLRALLDDEDEPVTRAVRGVIDRIDDPHVHRNLLRWLANPRLARSASRAMGRLGGEPAWTCALTDGHLLRTPRRRRALAQLDRAARSAPSVAVAVALPPAAQAHVPILLERLDLPSRVRRTRLADLVAMPSPAARQRAASALLAEHGAGVEESLIPFALDRDIRVARLAAQGLLSGASEPNPVLIERLANSGHRTLALRAADARARTDAAGFLRSWRLLPAAHRRAAAIVIRRADRAGLIAGLRTLLSRGTEDDRLDAIDLARRLRLVVDLEAELIELTGAESAREASAAVAALAEGKTALRVKVLADALRHPHPRVVANAVEGLARVDSARSLEAIVPFAHADANRPRANAVRAMIAVDRPRGIPALRDMLADANPLHRVSAIWAAQHGAAAETLDDLAEIARDDRVSEVRVRAEAARRWLVATDRGRRGPRRRISPAPAAPAAPVTPRVLKRGVTIP